MWYSCLFPLLLLLGITMTMKVNFFIDYFKHREVVFVCLLSCEGTNSAWVRRFTKVASKQFIAVSNVNMDHLNYSRINKCLDQHSATIGVVIDPSCAKSKEILNFASEISLFTSMHKWIAVKDMEHTFVGNDTGIKGDGQNEDICEFCNEFDNLNLSVDCDIIVAVQKDRHVYYLYDVYSYGTIQGGNLIVEKVGSWKRMTGFEFSLKRYKYYHRWNFNLLAMRLIAVVSPQPKYFDPNILVDRRPTSGVADITKTSASIMHVIAEIHNFRFNYTMADRWIGTFDGNDTKVVANALFYKLQDLTPALRLLSSLHGKMEFLQTAVASIETRYYYRIPTRGPGKFENQFLRPLSPGAWACVVPVLLLCACVLLLTAKLEQRPSPAQYAAFSALASMCQQFFQDTDDNGTRRSSEARKLTILVTGVSCVLIYNYYTSSVVSWLLNGPPPSINSLRELLDSPLELIFEDIGYTRSWMQTPTYYFNKRNSKIEDELRQKKVFNKKKDEPLFKSVEEGIGMVKAGGYAYHTEVNSANSLISRTFTQSELCELGSLPSMEKTHLYPCVQKNSPYKEFLNWSLLRLLERGIVSCVQQRISSKAVGCEGSSPRALALGGAAPAFLILAAGYFLAVAVMLVERLAYSIKRRSENMLIVFWYFPKFHF